MYVSDLPPTRVAQDARYKKPAVVVLDKWNFTSSGASREKKRGMQAEEPQQSRRRAAWSTTPSSPPLARPLLGLSMSIPAFHCSQRSPFDMTRSPINVKVSCQCTVAHALLQVKAPQAEHRACELVSIMICLGKHGGGLVSSGSERALHSGR
jgi:hypothetical protein